MSCNGKNQIILNEKRGESLPRCCRKRTFYINSNTKTNNRNETLCNGPKVFNCLLQK